MLDILKNSIKNNRISHSYIFLGDKEFNKLDLAKEFANEIAGVYDIFCVMPEKDSIKVEQIRQMQRDMSVKPIGKGKQVFIIDDADMMTESAQNCLLKTLEEPNGFVVIVLCVSNINKLLKTIQSRCAKINFTENIKGYVKDSFSDEVIDLLINIQSFGIVSVIDYQEWFENWKDRINEVLEIMSTWYRDFLIYKITGDEKLLINVDKKDYIITNCENLGTENLVNSLEVINKSFECLNMNGNYQMIVDNLIVGIWEEVYG